VSTSKPPKNPPAAPVKLDTPYAVRVAVVGCVLGGLAGAVCGYGGFIVTRYQATPADQAMLVGLIGLEAGLLAGGLVGLLGDMAVIIRRQCHRPDRTA
jgi:hypothetical protein